MTKEQILQDPRFKDITPFPQRVWLSLPTMHGDEQRWVDEAIQTNWVSTVGQNINEVEKEMADYIGTGYAVGLASGTSALHLATRLAGEKIYGRAKANEGVLQGKTVFCSDVTFDASVNPVAYENGEAVFIDTETDTWNMDPEALEKAFSLYPNTKLIVLAHLYGTPAKMKEIRDIADRHGAYIIEDAAESLGARYKFNGRWIETGALGDYSCISFNGNKIITGSSGGMFLTDEKEDADKIRKWSTQAREAAPWYQHEELGYNYRMSNIIAGIVRGQLPYMDEHIASKKAIYERYLEGFKDLPVTMNPYDKENSEPNFWLSCLLINEDAMAKQERTDKDVIYRTEPGKSTPSEILDAIAAFNAEGRPLWKPMHMQPIYKSHAFVTKEGTDKSKFNAIFRHTTNDTGADLFRRGLCLPSDNKMTAEQQGKVIEIVRRCFD